MSWRDRPYSGDNDYQPALRIRFRKPSTAVMWLVIANVVVHFVNVLSTNWWHGGLTHTFGLSLEGVTRFHFWQPLTYMFLHDVGGIWHLALNMIMLYFIGSEVERSLGRDRFLKFYATCGIVGGLAYLALAFINSRYFDIPLIGASGAVYGVLMAAIIFFPQMQIIFIIFPMPIRVFGLILAAMLLLQIISPGGVANLGGEVCHVAGAGTGLAIFYTWGIMPKIRLGSGESPSFFGRRPATRRGEGAWARKQKALAAERAEVDRILAKVHDQGLQSLSRKEKKILTRATQRQQETERKFDRANHP